MSASAGDAPWSAGLRPGSLRIRCPWPGRRPALRAVIFKYDRRRQAQRRGGEELVGDAEDRPQRLDATVRVVWIDSGNQEVAPRPDDQQAGEQVGREALHVAERFPGVSKCILQQVATHAGAGIQRGEDEQRFEHEREVIPDAQPALAHDLGEKIGHAHGQRGGAAGAAVERLLLHLARQFAHALGCDGKVRAVGIHLGDRGAGHRRGIGAGHLDVHGQIDARLQRACGDHGHDGHERLQAHGAVADGPGVAFARDDLGRDAAADQGVKPADGSAGDGDEAEGKELARHDWPGAVDELGHRRHLQLRQHEQHAKREQEDGAQLHERAEIVARREQQPHRQDAGGKGVDDDGPGEGRSLEMEHLLERGMLGNELPTPDRQQQERHAEHGAFQHFARANPPQVTAHEQRDGNGRRHGEDAPWRFGQCIHHHQREHGEQDDHDGQDGDDTDDACGGVQLIAHHLGERFAIAPDGGEQDDKVPAPRRRARRR